MKSEISYLVRRAVSRSSSTGPVPHRQRRPVEAVVRRRGSSSGGSSRRRERRSERSNRRGGGSGGAAAVEDCLPRRLCFIFYYCFRIFYIRARSSVCVRERGGGGRTPRTRRGGAREGRDRERASERESPFPLFFLPLTNPTANASGISEEATALCRGPDGSTSLRRRSSSAKVEAPSGQLSCSRCF